MILNIPIFIDVIFKNQKEESNLSKNEIVSIIFNDIIIMSSTQIECMHKGTESENIFIQSINCNQERCKRNFKILEEKLNIENITSTFKKYINIDISDEPKLDNIEYEDKSFLYELFIFLFEHGNNEIGFPEDYDFKYKKRKNSIGIFRWSPDTVGFFIKAISATIVFSGTFLSKIDLKFSFPISIFFIRLIYLYTASGTINNLILELKRLVFTKKILKIIATLIFSFFIVLALDAYVDNNQNTNNFIALFFAKSNDNKNKSLTPEIIRSEWGPERSTFSSLSMSEYITFNSIENIDTKYFSGDERSFNLIKEVDSKEWLREIKLEGGKSYEVISFFHNNSKTEEANEVKLTANLPASINKDKSDRIMTTITSKNSTPEKIWSTIAINADNAVGLTIDPESIQIFNDGLVSGKKLDGEKLFTEGVMLGFNKLDGIIPPNGYGYVKYILRTATPNFEITMKVSDAGENNWKSTLDKQDKDEIDFLIEYKNIGDTRQSDVILKVELPKEIIYDLDSTLLANANSEFEPINISDGITSVGYNIGTYNPNSNAFIKFRGKLIVSGNKQRGELLEVTASISTTNGAKKSSIKIAIDK